MSVIVEQVKVTDFTGDLRLVAESCGVDVALSMLLRGAGVRYYIPRRAELNGQKSLGIRTIERYVGKREADALAENLPGQFLYISKEGHREFAKRFIAENRYKYSPIELALELRVSETFVRDVIRDVAAQTDRQPSLFSSDN